MEYHCSGAAQMMMVMGMFVCGFFGGMLVCMCLRNICGFVCLVGVATHSIVFYITLGKGGLKKQRTGVAANDQHQDQNTFQSERHSEATVT